MKNYYEILEVSNKASKEVIEKAYKVLIKKNHPDTHNPDIERIYENYVKDINEAYEVLSNDFLRAQYDKELLNKTIEEKKKQDYNEIDKKEKKYTATRKNKKENKDSQIQPGIVELTKLVFQKRNFEEFKNNIKNKSKDDVKKDFIAMGLTFLILVVLGFILYFLPFTHNWMNENFIQNPLIQGIGKLFK